MRLGSALSVLRLVREVRRLPESAGERAEPYLVEVATAVRTLIEEHAATRLALRAYRLALRALLALGGVLVIVGAAIALGWRDGPALVIGLVVAALGAFPIWWWWGFSRGLRLLDRYADPARAVPLGELHTRLYALAREGEGLPDVPRGLVRDLRRAGDETA